MFRFAPVALMLAALLSACATPPRFEYVRDGASAFEKDNAVSECSYQIKLNKTAPREQGNLLNLCMRGKGFRYMRVG